MFEKEDPRQSQWWRLKITWSVRTAREVSCEIWVQKRRQEAEQLERTTMTRKDTDVLVAVDAMLMQVLVELIFLFSEDVWKHTRARMWCSHGQQTSTWTCLLQVDQMSEWCSTKFPVNGSLFWGYEKVALSQYPKDHWTLKTGYFEAPNPAIQVQTLPLEGPRSLG